MSLGSLVGVGREVPEVPQKGTDSVEVLEWTGGLFWMGSVEARDRRGVRGLGGGGREDQEQM